MKKPIFYIKNPLRTLAAIFMRIGAWLPDKQYLQILYLLRIGKVLHLNNPKTYNEKMQWLKLYNRKPEYTMMADKFAVKDYVSKIIGEEYIIKTFGVWERPEDIDWDMLPQQFVLKTTHGSGADGVIICKDKKTFNRIAAVRRLRKAMKKDVYRKFREWPYKNVRKRIIAEQFITGDEGKDLADYKLFCFDGVPRIVLICDNRFTKTGLTLDCYTIEWEHLDMQWAGYDNFGVQPRPEKLDEMLSLARKLSKGHAHIRCDFYVTGEHIYFGELTFFTTGGFTKILPKHYDELWGDYISLPKE